eukprot:733078-Pyramimonas_sp.AAC.1
MSQALNQETLAFSYTSLALRQELVELNLITLAVRQKYLAFIETSLGQAHHASLQLRDRHLHL